MTRARKKAAKSSLNNPYTRRLEHVRKTIAGGINLKEFHERLSWLVQSDGSRFDVSYSAARNYHYDREPPLPYLEQVARVFRVRAEWLLTGEGPVMKADPSREEAAMVFRAAAFGAVRKALGALYPIGVNGVDEMMAVTLPLVARARDATGEEKAKYLEAAASLGRAVAAPLEVLGVDPSQWSESVKAQYVLQTMAAVLVPLDLKFGAAVSRKFTPSEENKPTKRRKPHGKK